MTKELEKAKELIKNEKYKEALKLAKKRHGRDKIDEYLAILDMLIEKDYMSAVEERGLYHQYYDPDHDNGDYGEKYFDIYLKAHPQSINAICDKSMSLFNKNRIDEALEYMDIAYKKYDVYSEVEKPRIEKKEVKMGKIELLMQAKQFDKTLTALNKYEKKHGADKKVNLYKGQMLQKKGENKEALKYIEESLSEEITLVGLNTRANANYELKNYKKALNDYKECIKHEKEVKDDLELVINFNYKAAFCEIELGNYSGAIKHLNKTINMLNKKGRLPNNLEKIYQKCSFEKERIMKKGNIKDEEFKNTKFLSTNKTIYALIMLIVFYIILKIMGY